VAKRSRSSIPPDRLELYERLVATVPGLERKGASMPYTSVNGHMFSFLGDDGTLALRLPSTAREDFMARHATQLHRAHGTVMKEYVSVPPALLDAPASLAPYFRASHDHVAALKPKATRRG
jgi:TfoX N-terminal domain